MISQLEANCARISDITNTIRDITIRISDITNKDIFGDINSICDITIYVGINDITIRNSDITIRINDITKCAPFGDMSKSSMTVSFC